MIHSKIIKEPEFRQLPSTDAADVKENIDNWLDKNNQSRINTFLTKEPHEYRSFHRGYRFITEKDLEEVKTTNQRVIGIDIEITFYRKVTRNNISFYPLSFSHDYRNSYAVIKLPNGEEFEFKSDNNLKVRIREFKKLR